MKLVSYECEDCGYQETKLFEEFEDLICMLEHFCPQCGGIIRRWDRDNNKIDQIQDLR